jgi:hypothetical protein
MDHNLENLALLVTEFHLHYERAKHEEDHDELPE